MALLLAGLILFVLYAMLLFFYKRWWDRIGLFQPQNTTPSTLISVVIAARNEESDLPLLLDALAAQTYPQQLFEVIVVDDGSTDRTAGIAEARGGNVHVLSIEGGSKKLAIDAGVRMARNELIVTTDADCIPAPRWLETLSDFYITNKAAFIAAPVVYDARRSVLDIFQTLDFISLQGITAASVSAGFHSMCNGANLAYQRELFLEVKGFEGIDHVASGDDMLLMHKIKKAHPGKVHYLLSQDALVRTKPPSTWKAFFWQRIRWASKSSHYGDKKIIAVLLLIYVLNLYFIVLVAAGFYDRMYWSLLVICWIAKTAIELPFMHTVARFYKQEKLLPWFFVIQPLHILYVVAIGLLSQFGTYHWKGRKLK